MIDILEEDFVVSDRFNGAKIIKSRIINEAVQEYLNGEPVIPTLDQKLSVAFACKLSDDVKAAVFSQELGVDQAAALANYPGAKHFAKLNA